jgi:hypothetical protein
MAERRREMNPNQLAKHLARLRRLKAIRRKARTMKDESTRDTVKRLEREISNLQAEARSNGETLAKTALEYQTARAALRADEQKEAAVRFGRLAEELRKVCADLDAQHSAGNERKLFDLMAEARLLGACGASWERLNASVQAIKTPAVRRSRQTFSDLVDWVKIKPEGEAA